MFIEFSQKNEIFGWNFKFLVKHEAAIFNQTTTQTSINPYSVRSSSRLLPVCGSNLGILNRRVIAWFGAI